MSTVAKRSLNAVSWRSTSRAHGHAAAQLVGGREQEALQALRPLRAVFARVEQARAPAGGQVAPAQAVAHHAGDLPARQPLGNRDLHDVGRHALLERVEGGGEAHVLAERERAGLELVACVPPAARAAGRRSSSTRRPCSSSSSAICSRLEPARHHHPHLLAALVREGLEERHEEPAIPRHREHGREQGRRCGPSAGAGGSGRGSSVLGLAEPVARSSTSGATGAARLALSACNLALPGRAAPARDRRGSVAHSVRPAPARVR